MERAQSRMNSGTGTVSNTEGSPARVCRGEPLSVRHWAFIPSLMVQWAWNLSLASASTHCSKEILLLSRFYRWTDFGLFYCFKANKQTKKTLCSLLWFCLNRSRAGRKQGWPLLVIWEAGSEGHSRKCVATFLGALLFLPNKTVSLIVSQDFTCNRL